MIRDIEGLKKLLMEVGADAQEIADGTLNNGGCAVYAHYITNAMLNAGILAFGVVATHSGTDLDAQRPHGMSDAAWAWNDNGVEFNHVGYLIRCNKKVSIVGDSNEVDFKSKMKTLDGYPLIKGMMTRYELRGIIRDPWAWNRTFNRKHIPAIVQMISKKLSPEALAVLK